MDVKKRHLKLVNILKCLPLAKNLTGVKSKTLKIWYFQLCPLCTILQAVALLLHKHLFVCALDTPLTITQVGLKAPDPLLDLPALSHKTGRHHPKLQLQHQPWYVHSLAWLSKVSQT